MDELRIGDFARLGRVSVRMLRHYDEIGLLRPERVDPHSGYRSYSSAQLARLNRIVALKELGLRLEQVRTVVDDHVGAEELRAMLRLRQAELETEVRDVTIRLARVRARLRLIESEENGMSNTITAKTVPAASVLGTSAVAASATQEDIGPVVTPMFGQVIGTIAAAGTHPVGPGVSYYAPVAGDEDALQVHVGFPTAAPVDGLHVIEIPGAEVASLIHRGAMAGIDETYQLLHAWVRERGATPTGAAREIYLEVPDDQDQWVTEVQLDFVGR